MEVDTATADTTKIPSNPKFESSRERITNLQHYFFGKSV